MPHLSQKFAPDHSFKIKQSVLLRYFLLVSHGLALIASIHNGLPIFYKLLAVTIVLSSLFFYAQAYQHFQAYFLQYSIKKGWQLSIDGKNYHSLVILPTTVLTTYFIALHFHSATHSTSSLLIMKDALIGCDYKTLLVTLKISGSDSS